MSHQSALSRFLVAPFSGTAPQPASDDHCGVCGRHREKVRNNFQALYKFCLCCRRAKSKPYSFRRSGHGKGVAGNRSNPGRA